RAGRSLLHISTELLDRRPRSFGGDLDAAVGQVAHPTSEAETERAALDEASKADALHHPRCHETDANPLGRAFHVTRAPSSRPAVRAEQRHEAYGANLAAIDLVAALREQRQHLFLAVADRDHHSAALCELVEVRLRNVG